MNQLFEEDFFETHTFNPESGIFLKGKYIWSHRNQKPFRRYDPRERKEKQIKAERRKGQLYFDETERLKKDLHNKLLSLYVNKPKEPYNFSYEYKYTFTGPRKFKDEKTFKTQAKGNGEAKRNIISQIYDYKEEMKKFVDINTPKYSTINPVSRDEQGYKQKLQKWKDEVRKTKRKYDML